MQFTTATAAPLADVSSSFAQSWLLLGLLLAALIVLPWALRRGQQRWQNHRLAQGGTSVQTISATAVGPGQRVVLVEVARGGQRLQLILGVTAQNIHCLHVLDNMENPADSIQNTKNTSGNTDEFADILKNQPSQS